MEWIFEALMEVGEAWLILLGIGCMYCYAKHKGDNGHPLE